LNPRRIRSRNRATAKLRVHAFSLSLDGYGAGPGQDMDNPLGIGGMALHEWAIGTRTFRRIHGGDGGTTGVDDDLIARSFADAGIDAPKLGYRCSEHAASAAATHVVLTRSRR
jgi:hypothetical protein